MQSSRELFSALAQGHETPRAELEERYRPLLQAFARRVGVDVNNVGAVVDTALQTLFQSTATDPDLETRERIYRTAKAHIAEASLRASDVLQSDDALREAFGAEWRRSLVRFAIQSLSRSADTDARALQAFELHVIEKRNAGEVAKELGMTHTAVFGAKNLLLGKLQTQIEELESVF